VAEFLAQAPLSDTVRRDIARVYTERVDYLPGLSKEEKLAKLGKISYAEYLLKYCKLASRGTVLFSDVYARFVLLGHRCGFGAGLLRGRRRLSVVHISGL